MERINFLKSKKKIIEYLKFFDNACGTDSVDLAKEMPLITSLYNDCISDIIQPTQETRKLNHELANAVDELRNFLEPYEIKLLDKIQDLEFEIQENREIQSFLYGYLIANHLRIESNVYRNRRKNNGRRSKYNGKRNRKI